MKSPITNLEELVDIRDVTVDTTLPKQERIADFVRQIKNPYCYKHGNYVVRVGFTKTSVTLEERLEGYLASKVASSTDGM